MRTMHVRIFYRRILNFMPRGIKISEVRNGWLQRWMLTINPCIQMCHQHTLAAQTLPPKRRGLNFRYAPSDLRRAGWRRI